MARHSIVLMVAGTAAVLVALVVLWRSIRSDTAAPALPMQSQERAAQPTPPATTPSSPTAARTPNRAPASGVSAGPRPVPAMPAPAPTAPDTQAPPRDNNQGLEFGGKQLHAQTKAVEPLVRECVEKAAITGVRPTGSAMLTYIVAKRGDTFKIEDTGIDNEKTTLDNEALLECLHQTAKAMKFEGLPRGAQEIYAARRVTLENGKITEYRHVTFSYLR
jgi:hypothetical protein